MKRFLLISVLAVCMWIFMFLPGNISETAFWIAMPIFAGVLAILSLGMGADRFYKHRPRLKHLIIGIVSAGALYLIFFAGNKISTLIFPFAGDQIESIYKIRGGLALWKISILLVWIGICEEVFWRGYIQKKCSEKTDATRGWLISSAFYGLIHFASLNFMLMLAAAICGVFWGYLYKRYKTLWPSIISHIVWDILIFVIFPIHAQA